MNDVMRESVLRRQEGETEQEYSWFLAFVEAGDIRGGYKLACENEGVEIDGVEWRDARNKWSWESRVAKSLATVPQTQAVDIVNVGEALRVRLESKAEQAMEGVVDMIASVTGDNVDGEKLAKLEFLCGKGKVAETLINTMRVLYDRRKEERVGEGFVFDLTEIDGMMEKRAVLRGVRVKQGRHGNGVIEMPSVHKEIEKRNSGKEKNGRTGKSRKGRADKGTVGDESFVEA